MSPFLAVGLPLTVLGIALLVAPIAQRMRSAEAWGTIEAITTTHQCVAAVVVPPVNTAIDLPVVAFKTEAGEHVTATLPHGIVAPCMVGERIRVRYDRRVPECIWLPTRLEWAIPASVVALGLLCMSVMIAELS
jgi:hypothetical protein